MDIQAFDNVRVVHYFKDGYFAFKKASRNFASDISHTNSFHSNWGVFDKVRALIDLAKAALPNFVIQVEHVVLYLFDHL
jgi:hypothetical protein